MGPEELPKGWYELYTEGTEAAKDAGSEPWLPGGFGRPGIERKWVEADGKTHRLPCQYPTIAEPCNYCALIPECGKYAAKKAASQNKPVAE